jgi:hypothetical protein
LQRKAAQVAESCAVDANPAAINNRPHALGGGQTFTLGRRFRRMRPQQPTFRHFSPVEPRASVGWDALFREPGQTVEAARVETVISPERYLLVSSWLQLYAKLMGATTAITLAELQSLSFIFAVACGLLKDTDRSTLPR